MGNEADAGFRITAITALSSTLLGAIGCTMEKIVERERIEADALNYPASRPVDALDARVVAEFLGTAKAVAETTAAGTVVTAFNQSDGGSSGTVTMGNMVAGSVQHTMRRRMGGFSVQQTFELEGSLTYTPVA